MHHAGVPLGVHVWDLGGGRREVYSHATSQRISVAFEYVTGNLWFVWAIGCNIEPNHTLPTKLSNTTEVCM